MVNVGKYTSPMDPMGIVLIALYFIGVLIIMVYEIFPI